MSQRTRRIEGYRFDPKTVWLEMVSVSAPSQVRLRARLHHDGSARDGSTARRSRWFRLRSSSWTEFMARRDGAGQAGRCRVPGASIIYIYIYYIELYIYIYLYQVLG